MEFNDGMKDGFNMIRAAFMKAVNGQDPKEIADKMQSIVASGGKAIVEKTLAEFPPQQVEQIVRSVYGFIAGRELAEGVSTIAQSVNIDDLQTGLDNVLDQFKNEDMSIALARQLKGEMDKDMIDAVKSLMNDKINALNGPQAAIARIVIDQLVEPMLEKMKEEPGRNMLKDLRMMAEDNLATMPVWQQSLMKGLVKKLKDVEDAPVEEVAEFIRDTVSAIPTEVLAMQAYAISQSVTPERVMGITHSQIGKMPSPASISSVFTGVANAALKQLNRAADPAKADAPASVAEFSRDVADVLSSAAINDNNKKSTFDLGKDKGKGGEKFKI